MKNKNYFDLFLFVSVCLISIFGVIMIYSASEIWATYRWQDPFRFARQQGIFFIIGAILMFILSKIDYGIYKKKANIILMLCFLLLVLVLIPGIGTIRNGSRSWFGIGGFGIQPSEFAKIALVIFVSKYLSNNQKNLKNILKGVLPIIGIIALIFFLIMLQPDFGTAVVIILTLVGLLFVSGVKTSFFFKIGLIAILGMVGLILIAPYRIARISSFINPWNDPLGAGFQIIQSLYAIGPGGFLGLGFLNSYQKHFFLPEPQTDFIFSIISEEFGFLGVLIVCFFFLFIFYRSIKIALGSTDLFAKYLAFGLAFAIIVQAALNLMVVVGLIPVTGVTLPFFSYGGSSLLVSMASIGIILNISRHVR